VLACRLVWRSDRFDAAHRKAGGSSSPSRAQRVGDPEVEEFALEGFLPTPSRLPPQTTSTAPSSVPELSVEELNDLASMLEARERLRSPPACA